jgi:outer membrane protein OmpA-like peptidoglycan-associated protein
MLHKYSLLFALIFLFQACKTSLPAQDYVTAKTAPEKSVELFKLGRIAFYKGDNAEAEKNLRKAISKSPNFIDAQLLIGEVYEVLKRWDDARTAYNTVIKLDPKFKAQPYFALARIAYDLEQYDEAIKQLETFLTFTIDSKELKNTAERMLADAKFIKVAILKPVLFEPRNLGPMVNTLEPEYLPALIADGSLLFFTRRLGMGRDMQEDFFVAKADPKGGWIEAVNLGPPINTPENEGAQTISADGKTIVYTVCNRPEDFGSCDLYISELRDRRWTNPRNLGKPINTGDWESQPAISANGDQLIFTSNRPGGKGKMDFWISKRLANGQWSEPSNLETINSPEDESAPFFHPDMQTLYFRSKGYPGMGDYDLYLSRKNEQGQWGTPQNLGYPINTKGEEGGLFVTIDGKHAFFNAIRKGGYGGSDIYAFELPEEARPKPATYVRAKVYDAETKKPIVGKAEFLRLLDGQAFYTASTDETGSFFVCLPSGTDLALNVNAPGYLFHSQNFSLSEVNVLDKPYQLDIPLYQVPVPSKPEAPAAGPIVLRNVFFNTNSAVLLPSSTVELDKLKALLLQYPQMRIRLNGHTDNVGSDTDNQLLSDDRAKAVKAYLVSQGIDASRLETRGFGETVPICSNDDAAGRACNRRTEFEVLSNGN